MSIKLKIQLGPISVKLNIKGSEEVDNDSNCDDQKQQGAAEAEGEQKRIRKKAN